MSLTDKGKLRKFGLTVGSIFALIGFIPFLKGRDFNLPLIIISALLIMLASVVPNFLYPIYKIWMKIGKVLGRINSFLILSIIFYFVLTPIGFFLKRLSTNSEKFAYKVNKNSYWIKRGQGDIKEEMKRMF